MWDAGGVKDIWRSYVRHVGAGAIAMGGFISLLKSAPVFLRVFRRGKGDAGAANAGRDLPLKAEVRVESTVELPRHYTMDSIFLDILADPKAKAAIMPMIRKTMEIFGSQERDQGTEAAKEAITEDMTMAMMNYMPLRGAFSFGTGISAEEAEALLKKLNGET